MLIVDAQVHIWSGGPPPASGANAHRQIESFSKDDLLAEMDAAGRPRVAALDMQLDRHAVFEPGGAPFAGPDADHEVTDHEVGAQRNRYPRPASSCAVSDSGSPTTFE